MQAYPIGLQLYTVRELIQDPADWRRVVAGLPGMGYDGIEVGGTKPFASAREMRAFLDDHGLRTSAYWAQPTPESIVAISDAAATLGTRHLVGCWGPEQMKTIEEARKTAAAFQKMAELAQAHDLTMCYHNHDWEFVQYADGRYGWDVLMEEAPALHAQIDLYWASNFGAVDVQALVRRYASRTPLLHVKDGPLVKDRPNTAVGAGAMDIPACVRAADPNVLKWLVVELDRCGDGEDMLAIVLQSARYLRITGLGARR